MTTERFHLETLSGVSTGTASSATVIGTAEGLAQWDWFTVDATIIGAAGTGATSSAYLQRKIHHSVDEWREWIRFPDVAAGVTAKYSVQVAPTSSIVAVTSTTTAGPPAAPTMAANTSVGGHPGQDVRFVVYNGTGTTTGATCTCYIGCWKSRDE